MSSNITGRSSESDPVRVTMALEAERLLGPVC